MIDKLKLLLSEPERLDEAIQIYQKNKIKSQPGLEGKLKTLDQDARIAQKRIENLTLRLADLPSEMSPAPIYDQIKCLQSKMKDDERIRQKVENEQLQVNANMVDGNGLKERLLRAVGMLDQAPVENQRAIFNNVIQFAEVHPTKIRLGVYAPIMSDETNFTNKKGAAVTGGPAFNNLFQFTGSQKNHLKVAGSTTVLNGGSSRSRTGTPVRIHDFESSASTNSATEPFKILEESI